MGKITFPRPALLKNHEFFALFQNKQKLITTASLPKELPAKPYLGIRRGISAGGGNFAPESFRR